MALRILIGMLFLDGGSNNGRGNTTAAAEFNFYVDPHAAKAVFEAGFDRITVIPWAPLTVRDALFTRERLAGIEAIAAVLVEHDGIALDDDIAVGLRI